jgi:hypothetical protein
VMRRRMLPAVVALLAVLLCAAPAGAAKKARIGISDQNFEMFHQPAFQKLGLKRVRYLVPWDWSRHAYQVDEIDAFLTTAREHGHEAFVTFTAKRGCWTGARYKRTKACRAPTPKQYKKSVRKFRKRYGFVRIFAPWNEANHKSQPTWRKPRLAARYYNVLRKNCKGCTVLGADVLDQSDLVPYLRTVMRFTRKGKPRHWGLHNYGDVNRRRLRLTQSMLRTVPGQVWLTETGGIVKFRGFKYNEGRAGKRVRYLFKQVADRFDKRRRGMRSTLTRVYYYQWSGAERSARFDAGLVNPDQSVRRHFKVFRKQLKGRPR